MHVPISRVGFNIFPKNIFHGFDMSLCNTIASRVVGRRQSMVNLQCGSQVVDDLVDKF